MSKTPFLISIKGPFISMLQSANSPENILLMCQLTSFFLHAFPIKISHFKIPVDSQSSHKKIYWRNLFKLRYAISGKKCKLASSFLTLYQTTNFQSHPNLKHLQTTK